jgi:anti-sigma factor RsiW
MNHLGGRLSALIDEELSDAERDQVHAHLVGCDECRTEAAALRTLKRRVRGLGETPADGDLTRRLIALGGLPAPAGSPRSRRPGSGRARAAFTAALTGGPAGGPEVWDDVREWFEDGSAREDASQLSAERGRGHTRYMVVGAVAALAVSLGAASFAAGGNEHAPGPTVRPEVDVYMMQHAVITGSVPPAQPTTSARPSGGFTPGQLSFSVRP